MNRKSMDKRKNNFVNVLLVFCKCNNMFICNGRVDQDKGHGQLTSKNASVIDYVICSTDFLKFVQDFSTLFSDIHTPLSLTINNYVEVSSDNNTHIDGEKKIQKKMGE
jgi:hypothetical protein